MYPSTMSIKASSTSKDGYNSTTISQQNYNTDPKVRLLRMWDSVDHMLPSRKYFSDVPLIELCLTVYAS